jgi:hypothetical protein
VPKWLSASIAIYRHQADVFGGRTDGKFGVVSVKVLLMQVLISAGDNRVGVTGPRRYPIFARAAAALNREF